MTMWQIGSAMLPHSVNLCTVAGLRATQWSASYRCDETAGLQFTTPASLRCVKAYTSVLPTPPVDEYVLSQINHGGRMAKRKYTAPIKGRKIEEDLNPLLLLSMVSGIPTMDSFWREVGSKRRLISHPNKPTRKLHELFAQYLRSSIMRIEEHNGWRLHMLPSSFAFVKGSNPLLNAQEHNKGKFFYKTDIRDAYPSIDLKNLARLIVYIKKHDIYREEISLDALAMNSLSTMFLEADPLFAQVHAFLQIYCGGVRGIGLAVGGPISPYLMNLYCEAFVDGQIRKICERYEITYSRFADDFVFSRNKPIVGEIRKELRTCMYRAVLDVNHRKSFVLSREMGTVFVTKIGLLRGNEKAVLVFPRKKRKKLHAIIWSYLHRQMDWPERVSGYVGEFLHYLKNVEPTATDMKTFALCKAFEAEWAKYKKEWNKPQRK